MNMIRLGAKALCFGLIVASFSGCSDGKPRERCEDRKSSIEKESGTSLPGRVASDANEWPFIAWFETRLDTEKLAKYGVSINDCNKVLTHAKSGDVEDIRNLTVPSINGNSIRLGDLGTLDYVVVRLSGSLPVELLPMGIRGIIDDSGNYDALLANISLEVNEKKLYATGVSTTNVKKAIAELQPNTKYRLREICQLIVPGNSGVTVRLEEVAKVTIVWKKKVRVERSGIRVEKKSSPGSSKSTNPGEAKYSSSAAVAWHLVALRNGLKYVPPPSFRSAVPPHHLRPPSHLLPAYAHAKPPL